MLVGVGDKYDAVVDDVKEVIESPLSINACPRMLPVCGKFTPFSISFFIYANYKSTHHRNVSYLETGFSTWRHWIQPVLHQPFPSPSLHSNDIAKRRILFTFTFLWTFLLTPKALYILSFICVCVPVIILPGTFLISCPFKQCPTVLSVSSASKCP